MERYLTAERVVGEDGGVLQWGIPHADDDGVCHMVTVEGV